MAPYNVVPEIDETIAVVCVEPIAANMGLVPPAPGFLEGLRGLRRRRGDAARRSHHRFSSCRGGAAGGSVCSPMCGASARSSAAACPGRLRRKPRDMSNVAPLGGVYQAGTLSGNPLATAAGLAALEHLTVEAYAALAEQATRLQEGMQAAFDTAGVAAVLPRSVRCWASSSPIRRRTISIRPRPLPTTASTHGSSMGCSTVASPSHRCLRGDFPLRSPTATRRSLPIAACAGSPQPSDPTFSAILNHTWVSSVHHSVVLVRGGAAMTIELAIGVGIALAVLIAAVWWLFFWVTAARGRRCRSRQHPTRRRPGGGH